MKNKARTGFYQLFENNCWDPTYRQEKSSNFLDTQESGMAGHDFVDSTTIQANKTNFNDLFHLIMSNFFSI